MIKVEICNAELSPYDNYNDPDTTKRHVRKPVDADAILSTYADDPLFLVVEVDGIIAGSRQLTAKSTEFFSLKELLDMSSAKQPSRALRLIGFAPAQAPDASEVNEFRVSLRSGSKDGPTRGSVVFVLQNESEFDAVYGDRVKARPARPDAPHFTNDATSNNTGVACWNCGVTLAPGSRHCDSCNRDQ